MGWASTSHAHAHAHAHAHGMHANTSVHACVHTRARERRRPYLTVPGLGPDKPRVARSLLHVAEAEARADAEPPPWDLRGSVFSPRYWESDSKVGGHPKTLKPLTLKHPPKSVSDLIRLKRIVMGWRLGLAKNVQ